MSASRRPWDGSGSHSPCEARGQAASGGRPGPVVRPARYSERCEVGLSGQRAEPPPVRPMRPRGSRAVKIAVTLLHPLARPPWRAHEGDGGADLYAVEEVIIPSGERRDVGTGIALAIPCGFAGLVQARSGLAFKHGLMVVNAPGLIDSGYRGEVRVCLYNSGVDPFAVAVGDRIAQLVIQQVESPEFEVIDDLDSTHRGEGGFGSTGGHGS